MLIAGVFIDHKLGLLTDRQELASFVQSYVECNIERVSPEKLDADLIALDLKRKLEHAFNTQFTVVSVDAQTGNDLDDQSVAAALEVSTPLYVPSTRIH
jgi:hypothetical protein